jgi:UPF0755 protein
MNRGKILILLVLLLLLTVLTVGLLGVQFLRSYGDSIISLRDSVVVEYPRGTTLRALARNLEQEGIIPDHRIFFLWARFFQNTERLQAGNYQFQGMVSPNDILQKLRAGEVYRPVLSRFTLREGITIREAGELVAAALNVPVETVLQSFGQGTLLRPYGIDAPNLEGYLFPATYLFYEEVSVESATERIVQTFFERLPVGLKEFLEEKGKSLHEGVIIASMIEVETPWDQERSQVAEVIWNRLRYNMPLGIDAAVIYGIQDYGGQIQFKHLRDASNPYNLRIHRGLPPSPIASPSTESLAAVMTPSNEGYLYYVVDPERGNWHTFTKSLQEHNREVRKLVKSQRK